MKVKAGSLSNGLMFITVPLLRLSKTDTLAPCFMRASTRWLPIKPTPPVTNIFSISLAFILSCLHFKGYEFYLLLTPRNGYLLLLNLLP